MKLKPLFNQTSSQKAGSKLKISSSSNARLNPIMHQYDPGSIEHKASAHAFTREKHLFIQRRSQNLRPAAES